MLRLRLIVIALLGVAAVAASVTYMVRKQLMDTTPALDRDFVAIIYPTKMPLVYTLEIRKINKRADKQIRLTAVMMDFILRDSSGKMYASEDGGHPRYAEPLSGDAFDLNRRGASDVRTGKVRLRTAGLKPGIYEIRPQVRIWEVGTDRVTNPPANGSPYVAIPAGNSVKVTIR